MLDSIDRFLPARAGVGYKPQHFAAIRQAPGCVGWLEIHAENYMGAGGRPLAQLRALAAEFPISVHGVGLSIGGFAPLDADHLDRLKHLVSWLNPASFSEHLAWSTHESHYFNDLLPLPYTQATLQNVRDHINQVQDHLGRRMLLENPSTYVAFTESDMDEVTFLREVARTTGCGLLLDVNNVFVASTNQQRDPYGYIDSFPLDLVGEIHLAGHDAQQDDHGADLLIDTHDRPVIDQVWDLYQYVITKSGAKPTLIEWDANVPDWAVLEAEAALAHRVLVPA